MKQLVYILFLSLILSSCSSTFYYSSVNSKNKEIDKTEDGNFIVDNDILTLTYNFNGRNGGVNLTVYNKTDKPLYIDWSRSSLIVNNQARSYTGEKMEFTSESEGQTTSFGDNSSKLTFSDARFRTKGSVKLPKHVSFIPPKSQIKETPLYLNPNYSNIADKEYKRSHISDKNNVAKTIKRINFEESNSPFNFKSYLTIYTESENPITIENSFYIANIMKSRALAPKNIYGSMANRGDFFFVEK